ncbi:hypothetical protein F0562_035779 [Nyssa sinensis]|uniref:Uncharacterized protein n=1 Tax=Nyssa sinensis TaxID=561372 RepID=A0A5J5ADT7_9ASTE|nr:hypothetical protein F0562_035779 [Nyssa sinensis]
MPIMHWGPANATMHPCGVGVHGNRVREPEMRLVLGGEGPGTSTHSSIIVGGVDGGSLSDDVMVGPLSFLLKPLRGPLGNWKSQMNVHNNTLRLRVGNFMFRALQTRVRCVYTPTMNYFSVELDYQMLE